MKLKRTLAKLTFYDIFLFGAGITLVLVSNNYNNSTVQWLLCIAMILLLSWVSIAARRIFLFLWPLSFLLLSYSLVLIIECSAILVVALDLVTIKKLKRKTILLPIGSGFINGLAQGADWLYTDIAFTFIHVLTVILAFHLL